MIATFFGSLLVGYSGAMMPGSLLAKTLEKAVRKGYRAGLQLSLGHVLLEGLLVLSLFFGFGTVLLRNDVQVGIGLFGGLLLLFFAVGLFRQALGGERAPAGPEGKSHAGAEASSTAGAEAGSTAGAVPGESPMALVATGAILSATNPYFLLWWSAIGLGLMTTAQARFGPLGVLVFYAGHILSDLSWFTLVAAGVSRARHFLRHRAYRWMMAGLGAMLVWFSGSFILEAVRRLGAWG